MVILHTETLKKWGGQQNRVFLEAIGLRKKGHKVIIYCNKESILAHKAKEAGIEVFEANIQKQTLFQTIPRLFRIIKKEKVDIVCTHSSVDSWAGGLAAKLSGRKLVRFRHNLYQIGKNPLSNFIYSIPDKIICISDEIKRVLISSGIKVNKLAVICSGVDINRFNPHSVVGIPRKDLGISDNSIVIGNTSSFTGVKGQEYLLKAFNIVCEKHPSYLIFASRILPSHKEKYLKLIKTNFRNRVFFLGHRDDIPEVLKSIDIFVFPSIIEGLGTSLLEAMAMENPVVISDIPTFRDFITDKLNGLFFKPGDTYNLAAKIIFLIENKNLRTQFGVNARSTIIQKFSLDRMLDLTVKVYKNILNICQNNVCV